MTIGLTALVERYLTERRRLGFQLTSAAYSLRSMAEHVRRTRHRGPLTLEVMAQWARQDSHRSTDPRTWARRLKQLRPSRAAAVRAGHRSARRHDFRAAARAPGAAHLQRRGGAAIAGRRAPARPQARPARSGLRDAVRLDRQHRAAPVRGAVAEHRRRRSQARPLDDPAHQVRQVAPGAAAPEHDASPEPVPLDARSGRRRARRRGAVLARHAWPPVRQADGRAPGHRMFATLLGSWLGKWRLFRCRNRHTFVVRRILLWQQQGIDVDQAMLSLSTYVGHAMVTNTYWYMQAVPELMAVAAQRFESCMPELSHA